MTPSGFLTRAPSMLSGLLATSCDVEIFRAFPEICNLPYPHYQFIIRLILAIFAYILILYKNFLRFWKRKSGHHLKFPIFPCYEFINVSIFSTLTSHWKKKYISVAGVKKSHEAVQNIVFKCFAKSLVSLALPVL